MEYTVCIVEDDPDIRFMVKLNLLKEGYRVEEFEDAYPLFDKDSGWPDIFLLDIEIPGINGLEICGWIKAQPEIRHIPVLFLSGSPELKVLAGNTLADGYLPKPFKVPALMDLIRSKLPEKNNQRSMAG